MGVLCEKHGVYSETFCHYCNQELINLAKQDHKIKLQQGRKYFNHNRKRNLFKSGGEREKLKRSLQYYWRSKIFPYYEKRGLTSFCWIDPNHRFHPALKGKLFSAHVSHYYAKSHIYQLWTHPVNSGICCYNCNVNNPQKVAAMEPMIIDVWGLKRFNELQELMEMYLDRLNKGVDRKTPSDAWLIGMIAETKKMVIK